MTRDHIGRHRIRVHQRPGIRWHRIEYVTISCYSRTQLDQIKTCLPPQSSLEQGLSATQYTQREELSQEAIRMDRSQEIWEWIWVCKAHLSLIMPSVRCKVKWTITSASQMVVSLRRREMVTALGISNRWNSINKWHLWLEIQYDIWGRTYSVPTSMQDGGNQEGYPHDMILVASLHSV